MSAPPPGIADDDTVDAFHRGGFFLVQPARKGHRAGTDAMMLAAAVPSAFSGTLADLGAGAGAVGLAVAARCPAARIMLVEKSAEMAAWAERSLALPENRRFSGRVSLLRADVTLRGEARRAAGLADGSVDFAAMNPPFNRASDRATPDDLRREAHVMQGDAPFEDWLRTASAMLRPRGQVALIARPESLAAILAALSRRFGRAELLPIHPRARRPAVRIVVRAERGARGGLAIAPPLFLHEAEGNAFSGRAGAVADGRAALFGD